MNPGTATVLPRTVGRRLREIAGPDGLITEPDRLLAYECDALTHLRGTPLAAVFPASTDELAAVVKTLCAAGIPFVPRGAGTGLTGGVVARGEVLVCTPRMNRILKLAPEDRRAVVQPGVNTADISEAARPHGLRYLPDPSSAPACTIGGNVAQNAGGPHCLKHGVTTDHILKLRVVLPDGATLDLIRGEDGGLDLAGLFIGSEGTLGIAAEITVRLFPLPPAVRTALVLFDELADAGQAVSEILASGSLPVALELIDRATIRVVENSPYAAGLPTDVAAALVLEFEGEKEEVDAELRRAAEVARHCRAREVTVARSEAERERVWRARKKAYGALGRWAPEVMIQDATVPRTVLSDLLPRIETIAERHGVEVCNFFHAGDGNLHPNLPLDRRDPELLARVEDANRNILEACVKAGGTITGEHGIGLDKREAMRLVFTPAELEALWAVKSTFDPSRLCNRGKVLPPVPATEAPAS